MDTPQVPASVPSALDRIFQAADRLYEEVNRQHYPTVDAVRKLARVNMSDASSGMKSWRQQQTSQVPQVGTIVPESLQQTSSAALKTLWSQAIELANSTLRAAQAGWDAERTEAETLREQIATAYEAQSAELDGTQAEIDALRERLHKTESDRSALQNTYEQVQKDLMLTTAALQRSEARAVEIERRAEDLHRELERAHNELSELHNAQLVYRQMQDEKVNQLSVQMKQLEQQGDIRDKELHHTIDALNRATANFQKRIDLVAPPNTLASSTPTKSRSPKQT